MKYLLLAVMVLISHNLPAATVTATATITRDDVESQSDGLLNLTSPSIEFGAHPHIGIAFQGVTVPAGETINSAYIRMTAVASGSANASYTVKIESDTAASNYAGSGGGSDSPSTRPTLSESVTWAPEPWTSGEVYQSADLAPLVQALGTLTDARLGFIFSGFGERHAGSFDSGQSMELVITYGEVVEPPPVDVPVPTGLVIDPGEFGPYTKAFHIWEVGKVGPVLTWDASQYAVSYRVELRDIEKGAVALLGTTVNASWTLTFPAPGLYELMVTAIGADAKESATTFSGVEWVVYVRPAAVGNVGVE